MFEAWDRMTTNEKLDELKTQIEALAESISHLNSSLTASTNRALVNLRTMIEDLSGEVEELKE